MATDDLGSGELIASLAISSSGARQGPTGQSPLPIHASPGKDEALALVATAPLVFICYLLFAICYSFEPKARMTLWTPGSSRNSALS
jgi:uncharacterized BrkB/YihY/UPF0761 family membrane protein